jgi:hypothetical protein
MVCHVFAKAAHKREAHTIYGACTGALSGMKSEMVSHKFRGLELLPTILPPTNERLIYLVIPTVDFHHTPSEAGRMCEMSLTKATHVRFYTGVHIVVLFQEHPLSELLTTVLPCANESSVCLVLAPSKVLQS